MNKVNDDIHSQMVFTWGDVFQWQDADSHSIYNHNAVEFYEIFTINTSTSLVF